LSYRHGIIRLFNAVEAVGGQTEVSKPRGDRKTIPTSTALNLTTERGKMDTVQDLKDFVGENMPGATVVLDGDELVVRTGLGFDMGTILYPLNEEK
jgi:hypothetical protein